jgi:hypothetical protein
MASSFLPSSDALIESFPTPSLPSIQGEPTYPQLAAILTSIKANAAFIPSKQEGGRSNGHLGIIVSDMVYATIAPVSPFVTSNNLA